MTDRNQTQDKAEPRTDSDLQDVISELQALRELKWRGSVEYRFDGSGRIVSAASKSYHEISLE